MMNDLKKAKEILLQGGLTCVLCKGEEIHTSTQRGVKPLVAWLYDFQNFKDFCAADKVIGKATAFLYVLLGAKAVFANVISHPALEVLKNHGINTEYVELVDNIINRQGDGICPFESAVLEIENPTDAYEVILKQMEKMNISY